MASASTADPQTFNRYSYVGNSPLTLIDPSGMFGICPGGGQIGQGGVPLGTFQMGDQRPELSRAGRIGAALAGALTPPVPKVTVTPGPIQPLANVPLPDGTYVTGLQSRLTITITDQSGKPIEGLTVTESNKVLEAEPRLPHKENKAQITPDSNGSFDDIVSGRAQDTSFEVSGEEATKIVQKQIENRTHVVTEQT